MNPETLLQRPSLTQKCTLGCPVLDRCLVGGIPCNSLTEIVAESGSGKTQLCLQFALNSQLPISHGGLRASSIYIHTEFPFPSRRLHQLSRSFLSKHSNIFGPRYDPCDRIFVYAVHDADQLLDVILKMESFIVSRKSDMPIRLLVIDSIAAVFRSEFDNSPRDLKRRSSLFFKISGELKSLAKRFDMAVVVTNQVVDLVKDEGMNGLRIGNLGCLYSSGRRVSPALGLAWANCVNSRLFLSRDEEVGEVSRVYNESCGDLVPRKTRRMLHVLFAPHLPASSCEFVIAKDGVWGVDRQ